MLLVFSFLLSCVSSAEMRGTFDWSCETSLAPVAPHGREVFADFIRLPSGSELFTRIEVPEIGVTAGWIVLGHGLADSHRAWDGVTADLIKRGFGVARFDWRGFARSLHDRHPMPDVIDYTENVRDLRELVIVLRNRFRVERPMLVGHSMGGGLVLALLADPLVKPLLAARHVIFNPYVYRAEYYIMEKYNLAIHGWTPPLFQMMPQFMIDSLVEPHLRRAFSSHLREQSLARGTKLTSERFRRNIARQVDVALGVTRGLRKLDGLEMIAKVPNGVRIDEVYGRSDGVVEPALARRLGAKLERRGGRVIAISGDHWLPEKRPHDVANLIADPDFQPN